MTFKTTYILMLLSFFSAAFSVEDMYHQNIRSQLADQYGISGGTWALRDNEKQTHEMMQMVNVSCEFLDWPGGEPFTEVAQIGVKDIRINPWDQAIRLNTSIPIQKGDAMLLIVWMNNVDTEIQTHPVTHVFEATTSPFEKSLYQEGDVKAGWRQWILPFEADTNYDANQARFQINLGHMQGDIQIAGIALLNFGTQYSVQDLPLSTHHLEYDGREGNAPWRTEALTRINKIRKGDMRVRVLNKYDEPIKGASISVDMKKHAFGFGTAVSTHVWFDESYDSKIYLQKLQNLTGDGRSFNIVAIEKALKWPAWENPYEHGDKDDVVQVVEWLADRDIKIRGHNLLWPSWDYMPSDMMENSNNPSYLIGRIQGHIYEQVRYNGLKGIIDEWDVINEIGICHDLVNALKSDDIYSDVLSWTAQSDGRAKLFLNENNIIADGGLKKTSREQYRTLIAKLLQTDAPLHGIGIQGHMSTSLTAPETILNIFDEFKPYNLNISITEYDAVGVNEELAGDYMRDILIAAFSHESVSSFIMWGFWDGAHWKEDSPIFRRDWSVKPSGEKFIQWVFHNWWTNAEGQSNKDGEYTVNAFYGDYDVKVEFDNRETEALVEFSPKSEEIILHVDTDYTTVQPPIFYRLEQNFPNPFNGTTAIEYELPFRDHVVVDLFNIQGKHVQKLLDATKPAGRHVLQVDAYNFPSGLYYYRLQSGKFRQTKKMLLIR